MSDRNQQQNILEASNIYNANFRYIHRRIINCKNISEISNIYNSECVVDIANCHFKIKNAVFHKEID